MYAADSIEYQVINGKNNMPAFGGRLTDDEITDASYYVVYQAGTGWNKSPLYVRECSSPRDRNNLHPCFVSLDGYLVFSAEVARLSWNQDILANMFPTA